MKFNKFWRIPQTLTHIISTLISSAQYANESWSKRSLIERRICTSCRGLHTEHNRRLKRKEKKSSCSTPPLTYFGGQMRKTNWKHYFTRNAALNKMWFQMDSTFFPRFSATFLLHDYKGKMIRIYLYLTNEKSTQ